MVFSESFPKCKYLLQIVIDPDNTPLLVSTDLFAKIFNFSSFCYRYTWHPLYTIKFSCKLSLIRIIHPDWPLRLCCWSRWSSWSPFIANTFQEDFFANFQLFANCCWSGSSFCTGLYISPPFHSISTPGMASTVFFRAIFNCLQIVVDPDPLPGRAFTLYS